MQDEEKTKKWARQSCRALSLHCRQFPPNGMNRVEDQGHSGFAGVLHTANTKKRTLCRPVFVFCVKFLTKMSII